MAKRDPYPTCDVMARISTPCIRVCLLDPETGLCEGCGRTGDEIALWGAMSEDERRSVMGELDARMRAAFLPDDGRPAAEAV